MFFICIYIHIGRGLYYHSFNLSYIWLRRVIIFILSITTAFLGYVFLWGQISYWGATVITNLITTISYIGIIIIEWIWKGYSINNVTLNRFFSFYFIFHHHFHNFNPSIFSLWNRIKNLIRINRNFNKIPFNVYFILEDILGLIIFLIYSYLSIYSIFLYLETQTISQKLIL
jgi:ubiquinol-cytochrome c reductase cytochrome b subunit